MEDEFYVSVPPIYPDLFLDYVDVPAAGPPPALQPVPNNFPQVVRLLDRHRLYSKIWYDTLIIAGSPGDRQGWQGSSGTEEWNLADSELKILHPGHRYTLTVETAGEVVHGKMNFGATPHVRTFEFQADRAPDWEGALQHAVFATYPSDGHRPVFRGYDLKVRFTDDYVRALYDLDKRRLGIRLRDANGAPVEFAKGKTLSPPIGWTQGAVILPPVEKWWRAHRATDPCEAGTQPPPDRPTVLPVVLAGLDLKPLARYTAELLAVEDEVAERTTVPLASWSFTTSSFMSFTDLASAPSIVPALGLVQHGSPAGSRFGDLILSFGAPAIATAPETRMTPVRVGNTVAYLLIEAPEPLDDVAGRLAVTINATPGRPIPNLDQTRIIFELTPAITLEDARANLEVVLNWAAAAPDGAAENHRTIAGAPPATETCEWHVPLRMLF